jgi:hypothetical protein
VVLFQTDSSWAQAKPEPYPDTGVPREGYSGAIALFQEWTGAFGPGNSQNFFSHTFLHSRSQSIIFYDPEK